VEELAPVFGWMTKEGNAFHAERLGQRTHEPECVAYESARWCDSLQGDGPVGAQAGDVVGIFDRHPQGDDGRAVLAGPGGPDRCRGEHEPAAAVMPDLLGSNWEPDHADQVPSGQTVGGSGAGGEGDPDQCLSLAGQRGPSGEHVGGQERPGGESGSDWFT
jgi:hypothetical protein